MLTQAWTPPARGHRDDLVQAAAILAESRAKAIARHSRCRLIEVVALQSLVHVAQGDEPAALADLRRAVDLAAPGGALRLLVDCGPGLIGPLQKLQAAGVAPGYIQRVLAAYGSSVVPAAAARLQSAPGYWRYSIRHPAL